MVHYLGSRSSLDERKPPSNLIPSYLGTFASTFQHMQLESFSKNFEKHPVKISEIPHPSEMKAMKAPVALKEDGTFKVCPYTLQKL